MLAVGPREWGLASAQGVSLSAAGGELEVLFEADGAESARRAEHGPVPGALDWRQLEVLAALPLGHPVPWAEVDFDTALEIDCLPPGCIVQARVGVIRVWRPPVTIRAVATRHAKWDQGLHYVSQFAGVAPRVLLLETRPRDIHGLRKRAATLGVGVCDAKSGEPWSEPPSTARVREDARRWEIAERIYEAIRLTTASTSARAGG